MRKSVFSTILLLVTVACGREVVAPPDPPRFASSRTDIQRTTDPYVGFFLGSCDGFDVVADFVAELQINSHYDRDGNLARQEFLFHTVGQAIVYNSAHPEAAVLSGSGEGQNAHWDYVNGWFQGAGMIFRITLPGRGPIFMETGLIRLNIETFEITHFTGHNQWVDGDLAALCAVLTP